KFNGVQIAVQRYSYRSLRNPTGPWSVQNVNKLMDRVVDAIAQDRINAAEFWIAFIEPPGGPHPKRYNRDWPPRPQCGRTPNQNSLWPSARSGLQVSVRFGACRDSDGIWSHRTCGQSACNTKPEWYRVWPRRRLGPEPCARVASRFQPGWISPDG